MPRSPGNLMRKGFSKRSNAKRAWLWIVPSMRVGSVFSFGTSSMRDFMMLADP
jgi:hypothetical protein